MSRVTWYDQEERELYWEVVGELLFLDVLLVAELSGVRPQTLYRWIDMETLYPQWRTLSKVAKTIGFQFRYRKNNATLGRLARQRPRIRRAA